MRNPLVIIGLIAATVISVSGTALADPHPRSYHERPHRPGHGFVPPPGKAPHPPAVVHRHGPPRILPPPVHVAPPRGPSPVERAILSLFRPHPPALPPPPRRHHHHHHW